MLAERLKDYRSPDTVVLALPRGGVPVAFELAAALGAKLDVLLVRKLGVPGQPELAMGAIASAGAQFVDRDIVRSAHVSQAQFESVLAQQTAELARQEKLYHADNTSLEVESKTVIVVDDGIATGATMQAAAHALRERHPAHVIVAVPVAPAGVQAAFEDIVDEFVCVAQPTLFLSVGQHYDEFAQTSDGEVLDLLSRSRRQ